MIRALINNVQPGDILARSVLNPNKPEKALLQRGVSLTKRILTALRRFGIRSLWLEGDGMGYLEDLIKEEHFQPTRKILGQLRTTFLKMSGDLTFRGSFAHYRDRVIEIFQNLADKRRIYCLLDDIQISSGDALFHGGNVCYLSLLIGLEAENYIFEQRRKSAGSELAKDFAPLGLGALLHDIGKLKLKERIRNAPLWDLSQKELLELQSHTEKGYEILRPQLGAIGANMALCHHKNFDSTGYPLELQESGAHLPGGNSIHIFSRVVALANSYEQLVGTCNYLPIKALEELNCARRHHFDQKLLQALNRIIPPFSLGSTVELNTGHTGIVIDFDPDTPFQPAIIVICEPDGSILPEARRSELKLADYPKTRILKIDNRSISHILPDNFQAKWEDIP